MSRPATRSPHLLIAYLRPLWQRVLLLALLLLGVIGLELGNPLILRAFIDRATTAAPLDQLLTLAGLFLGVALLVQAASVGETYVAEDIALTATNRLRSDLLRHCLSLDPHFHAEHTPGELIERVDGDVATLATYFSRFVVHLLGNGVLLVGVLILVAGIDWRIGTVLAIVAVLAIIIMDRLRAFATPRWTAQRAVSADLFGFLEERLAGTEEVRASGAVAHTLRQLAERAHRLLRAELVAVLVSVAGGNTSIVLLALGTGTGLGLAGWLYLTGQTTIGSVYLIFIYSQMLSRPIEQITRQLQELQRATASLIRVRELLAITGTVADTGRADLPRGPLAVAFEGVIFGYEADERVLSDLSFALPAGEILGVLGRTGSGKTTLIRLLFRLYDPVAGTVRLGGVDARAVPLAALRHRVGLVSQEIQLFHASLRDNLTFFDPAANDDRIVAILHDLGLSDWYASLPDGLATRLAPGGSGLSAGEAQLLSLARVFLQEPDLVILDEASSRLDPATERRLEAAIDRLLVGRTGIIIAHRLRTVQRADTILVLEDGRRREWGPRAELEADPHSRYAGLLRTGLEVAG